MKQTMIAESVSGMSAILNWAAHNSRPSVRKAEAPFVRTLESEKNTGSVVLHIQITRDFEDFDS
ncbi:MAG: hypothetical protein ACPIE8_05655 [Henriciella sp.]